MFRILLLVLVVFAGVLVLRTWMFTREAPSAEGAPAPGAAIDVNRDRVVQHLSRAVTFPTVSVQPPAPVDRQAFDDFLGWLESTYPQAFQTLAAERIADHSLLLTWQADESDEPPVLLAAHYDVVPVPPDSESRWTHPPFAGTVADGYVWGRGALDNKNAVIGILEAVSWMLRNGEQPGRTVYIAFGHDEEIGGEHGAAAIVTALRNRGVHLAWTLDEGSFVFENMFPGVELPIATINVAEKGSVTMRIIASAEGGHSSMPDRHTAVGRLAAALVALEQNPMPGGLEGLAAQSFDEVARHMPFLPRMMFANRWLFGPLVEGQLADLPFANAMLRTTTAPTMLRASPKVNVLPTEAVATVNFRIHPRDSVEDVIEHVESLVADEHVRVEPLPGNPASPVSDPASEGFRLVERAVRAEFGDVVVAPGLLIAATDSRHYGLIADNALRFNPMVVTQDELNGFHGIDERIRIDGLTEGVRTYIRLLRSL